LRRISVNATVLELVVGNIVTEETEAIVNPAQKSLFPGGGVDGEIHLWGGSQIWQECRELNGCEPGDAKITTGGDLRALYVIHTVGPIWSGGDTGEAEALASCYRRCLEVASENHIRSIAFPAISTGNYSYPLEEAAEISLRTVVQWLKTNDAVSLVRFIVKGRTAFDLHSTVLDTLITAGDVREIPISES
jgi:O-acetyl-ADP-ribose deacetylase (regulator of RNase III)